jgi:hypothetical protein
LRRWLARPTRSDYVDEAPRTSNLVDGDDRWGSKRDPSELSPNNLVDHAIFRIHKGAVAAMHVTGADRPDLYQSITYSKELAVSSGH